MSTTSFGDNQATYFLSGHLVCVCHSRVNLHEAGFIDESKDVLDLAAKRSNSATWPYPIIIYLRNEIGADALIAMAGTNNERLIEAHGYLGMDLMLKDQRDEALAHFKWVRDRGNRTFVEYTLAGIEINRLESGNRVVP